MGAFLLNPQNPRVHPQARSTRRTPARASSVFSVTSVVNPWTLNPTENSAAFRPQERPAPRDEQLRIIVAIQPELQPKRR
jgi:hypothetical protein